jgi:hypothetical protein
MYGRSYRIGAVANEIERSADIYPNAHTSVKDVAKDWGIHLRGPRKPYGGLTENWLNTGWAYKDAVAVAQRWVVYGEVPSKNQQEMCLARHRLDPGGHAPKRRRLAFEAAWIANDKKLAEEILIERVRLRKRRAMKREAHA